MPAGSFDTSTAKSHSVGWSGITSAASAALPSLPGSTTRSPAWPATPIDSIQPRRAALCFFSQSRQSGWETSCTGREEEERSTKGNDMAMLTFR